jgi:hypothetical protein
MISDLRFKIVALLDKVPMLAASNLADGKKIPQAHPLGSRKQRRKEAHRLRAVLAAGNRAKFECRNTVHLDDWREESSEQPTT